MSAVNSRELSLSATCPYKWTLWGSNSRPRPCRGRILPTEIRAHSVAGWAKAPLKSCNEGDDLYAFKENVSTFKKCHTSLWTWFKVLTTSLRTHYRFLFALRFIIFSVIQSWWRQGWPQVCNSWSSCRFQAPKGICLPQTFTRHSANYILVQ